MRVEPAATAMIKKVICVHESSPLYVSIVVWRPLQRSSPPTRACLGLLLQNQGAIL